MVATHRNITSALNVLAAMTAATTKLVGEENSPYACVLCPVPLFHATGLIGTVGRVGPRVRLGWA